MRKLIRTFLMVIEFSLLIACSSEQTYNSMQGARETECQKIVDNASRNQCLDEAHKSYNRYEQQRSESRAE